MKNYLCVFVVMIAAAAVGQTYKIQSWSTATKDVTTMTNTVNAWKYFPGNPACAPATLAIGVIGGSPWCTGISDHLAYKFDLGTKKWVQHPEMGSSVGSFIVVHDRLIYSLQNTSDCGTHYGGKQSWGLFSWNSSNNTWARPLPGSCFFQGSADYNGKLYLAGFDVGNNVDAAFTSTNGGTSIQLLYDGWNFINVQDPSMGCVLDLNQALWSVNFDSNNNPVPYQLPSLPSGTAAGCLYAKNPSVLMAWTTTGAVYTMPLENYGTWQAVTGISAQTIVGHTRFWLHGEDTSGKPYHWSVNAPGVVGTYGGQWTQAQGCPTPGTPCNNPTTHTLHHSLNFTSCHGLNGCNESVSTQLWSSNFSLPHSDYNPQCDPFLGGGVDDPECHVTESAYGHCNASGATLDPTGTTDYYVDDSIDVLDYLYNTGSEGPDRHTPNPTLIYSGYYDGHIYNKVTDGCAVSDPIPVCPVDTSVPLDIYLRVDWEGKLAQEGAAYATWNSEAVSHRLGYSAPYVAHGWYLAKKLPGGSVVLEQCYGGWLGNTDFLWGDIYAAPACK